MATTAQLAFGLIEAECRDDLKAANSLLDRVRIAFKVAKNHWMITDEDEQFRGACGAILHHSMGDDKERIEAEMRQLRAIAALMSGAQVEIPESTHEPIGLVRIWREGK